jgi:MFS family permease
MSPTSSKPRAFWPLVLCAAGLLLVTMGGRQSLGLFVAPIQQSTGMGIVGISFAMAINQLVWGAVQPVFGAIADQYGSKRVILIGTLLACAGYSLTPLAHSQAALMLTLGVLAAIGTGAASFSILIGATAGQIPPQRQAFASGVINAGSSLGQAIYAPMVNLLIATAGWSSTLYVLSAVSLLSLGLLPGLGARQLVATAQNLAGITLGQQLRIALREPSYWMLHAGLFTCGLHIGFLVTHLPGEVALCGLPAAVSGRALALIGLFNIAGSLIAGVLGSRYRMKYVLGAMYASRVVIIALYLMAPRTSLTFYLFAAALGFSWLATVPPSVGLIGKLFGTRYLGTLFGLTLLSHQLGGFFGAWLGGVTISRFGDFGWMWYADMAFAAGAAILCLPIREARVQAVAQPA